jgi:hypothetical protein
MRNPKTIETQLGFDGLLASAETANTARQEERACAHLPGSMNAGVPFLRGLIERHHQAMVAGDAELVQALREDAHRLALKLNAFDPGILADDDAAGRVLDRETAAPSGTLPLWGQSGIFEITCIGMRVSIEMDGIFGIGASSTAWLGFAAHAVEPDRPFLSETGYRSFLGVGGTLQPGFTPATFAAAVVAAHVQRELKGKLLLIKPEYRRDAEPVS